MAFSSFPVQPNYQVCTSGTRPPTPAEGQAIYETDTDKVLVYNGSAWELIAVLGTWTTYTPGDTGVTVGNGTRVAKHKMLSEKTCAFRWGVFFGSTTTFAATTRIGLPFTPVSDMPQAVAGWCLDSGTQYYPASLYVGQGSTSATPIAYNGGIISNTIPFTWASGDFLIYNGVYEIA